jgi:hypothetical protein
MLYISYQGIYDGQDYESANTPTQINKALGKGYSCLIYVWRVNNKLYVGNGQPLIEVTEKYIQGPRLWINAVNTDMQTWIATQSSTLYPNYFHFDASTPPPPYATASNGKLITPGTVPINNTSVMFLPEINDRSLYTMVKVKSYGICSGFLTLIKRMRNEGVWY